MGYRDETFGLRIDSELKTELAKLSAETRLSMSDLIHDCCYSLLPIIKTHRLIWTQLQELSKTSGKPIATILLECIQQCLGHLDLSLRETAALEEPKTAHSPVPTTRYPGVPRVHPRRKRK